MPTPIKPLRGDAAKKVDEALMEASDGLRRIKQTISNKDLTKEDLLVLANENTLRLTHIILTLKDIKTE